jgi:hypothetical protein
MIGLLQHQRMATIAAHQATCGAEALLSFAVDGPELNGGLQDDAIEKIADALKITLELQQDLGIPDPDGDRGQLLGACAKFLEGWAG